MTAHRLPGLRGPTGRRAVLLIAAVATTLLMAAPIGATALGSHRAPAPPTPTAAVVAHGGSVPRAAAHPSSAYAPAAPVLGPPPATGRGTFFTTSFATQPAPAHQYCPAGGAGCLNATNSPVINLTSTGVLAVAYTAYDNQTACANVTNYAATLVGVTVSRNGGGTWSAPTYLGNPDCTVANDYPSAWQPSLTSLANGTLVLAYIEYNTTKGSILPGFFYTSDYAYGGYYGDLFSVRFDRLVLSESYNGGSSWTTPIVLNSSSNPGLNASAYGPARPWVTAVGQTVYVTWMNYTQDLTLSNTGSSAVHLKVSIDGGRTFGAAIDLTTVRGSSFSFAMNPFVAIGAAGELLVAYVTNVTFWSTLCGGPSNASCFGDQWTADVELATSTNNGSTLVYHAAARQVIVAPFRFGPFHDPSPQVVYAKATHQLLVTFSAAYFARACYFYGCYPTLDYQAYITNSSNGGATWAPAHFIAPSLDSAGYANSVYNPSIAVDAAGRVHAEMTYVNGSIAGTYIYGTTYGAQQQWYAVSLNNGTSFGAPILISDNSSVTPYFPDGEYDTLLTAGNEVYIAWTLDDCFHPATSYCFWPYGNGGGVAQVAFSTLFLGAGAYLNFTESGLTAGTVWSASVMGNLRSAVAPAALSVAGVPVGENITYNVSNPAAGYGLRYFGVLAPPPPTTLTASTTVTDTFTEQVLVNITTVPYIPGNSPLTTYCGNLVWNNPDCSMINYNITPNPGPDWVNKGTSLTLNVTNRSMSCVYVGGCYFQELNLSWVSWSGSGSGSSNTTANLTRVTANAPMNETANFVLTGFCQYDTYGGPKIQCWKQNASLLFHESGLPKGTAWNVTLSGSGVTTTLQSTGSWLVAASPATSATVGFTVWTIPAGSSGYWVPSTDPISPVYAPTAGIVSVTFRLVASLAGSSFPLTVNASGLPAGTAWSTTIGANAFGVTGTSANFTVAGGTYSVGGAPVYLENGTEYTATTVVVTPLLLNSTSSSGAAPYSFTVKSPTLVTVVYVESFLVTASAGAGGSVTLASQWVASGGSVAITARPNAGYSFVGWTGTGYGALSGNAPTITVVPAGPVNELAEFAPIPAKTWLVNVTETGLPPTVAYSVGLGPLTHSGRGAFQITTVASGTYALTLPIVYLNGTNTTRWLPSLFATSFTQPTAGNLSIATNGSIVVAFAEQHLLTVGATGPGTVSPLAGTYWEADGAAVALTATPVGRSQFVSWNGTGDGAVSGSARSLTAHVNGAVIETAEFLRLPTPPPQLYHLSVTETGLPPGAAWSANVGLAGASSTGTTVTIAGLNGSYTLVVPPVAVGAGDRFVADATSGSSSSPVTVTANGTATVAFVEQFQVTVASSVGGFATPAGATWVTKGSSLALTATAAAGYVFAGWVSTGHGNYSGASTTPTVAPTGAVTEYAQFTPIYHPAPAVASSNGAPLAFGLLALLAIVGFAVGYLAFRRRGRPPTPTGGAAPLQPWEEPPAEGGGAAE
ncbi:MAG TPA: hypothetical protein VFF67_04485 [Thermoplasmata archaeon]|nr:hypothetical protein [Thermoplasmata archaeon]